MSENINKEATDGTENKQKREESKFSKRNENSVDNIVGNSVAKNPKMKETVLHLKFWTVMKCEDEILKSLIGIIAEVPFKVDKIAYSDEENWTKLDIKFASVSMSRTFCSQLRRNRDKLGIRFETLTPAPKKKDMKMIEDQLKSMCKRSAELLQWHLSLEKMEENKLISLAEDKGGKNKKGKYVSIDKFNQRESQRRALIDKIGEYKGQRNEFQIRLAEITKKLEAMKHEECMKESLRDVMKDFNIEYSRLKDSLPMYAKRTDIVELIKENQVSIILGETGSGKSTQLTQYIYQANMANGLIVCTQPRKVAAISLASRVAQEMNDNVGHLVGYHVGMKSKKNHQTKILYMTDHLLLNECLEDNLLLKYSCIIIDEAHERSIYTDLLLGMIKSILPFRDDLRVVVTSATINPEVFVDYFGYAPVLRVSGRMFPVGVEWVPSSFNDIDDYEDRALRKALEVHEKEPPGDILVFLTSQLEIERSIEKMEAYLKGRRDAIIMPLHGKLQADEQGRIFDATPKGKRKIVFATNIAETSLTIPGVKYVIDTGFAKEMTFDPSRNLSSLDVSYISKSSAEQRKGRAGRTDVGKCYRLYARETFDNMREIAAPEILKIHLGHAILKLLQLDVNPLEFDFVEAPSKAFLDSAYDTLQNLDCVADGKITAKGKWIAKLPLSPNLGSLVHDAVESEKSHGKEIAIEGVVLAACCTTGGSLFYRAGSIEQKREADKLKVPFCHSAGDHLTYLNVYREWHKVEEKRKGRWCRENSVNGKAMRGIRDTVNEILQTLKKELGVRLHFTLSQTSSNDEVLQSFIFKAFMTNVCYFLGHQKAGYHFIDKNQRVTVHPSSAIESLGSQPSWVVLERVMKTSKEFALNITVVKEGDVMDALSRGFLTFDLDAVKKQRVEEVCVEFVGSQLHREFVGVRYKNVKQMEEDLSSEGNDIFIVEADRSKGAVSVFTTEENKTLSESVLKESISPLREKIKLETVEIPLTDKSMNILATIGPGGSTVDISAPNEYKTILVYSAADEMFDEKEVRRLFERKFGQVREVIIKSPHSTNVEYWGKVTFVDPEAAAAAVAELNEKGSEIWTRPTLRVSREQNSFRAAVSWCRRRGKGFGFVQIHDASLLSSLCNKREIIVANSHARVTRSKKTYDEVYIAGFNELVDEGVLKESVVNAIKALDDDIGKVVVVREKVQTSPDMMQTFKRRLKAKIESYVKPGSFRINLMQPLDGHTTYRGSVIFDDPDAGDLACKRIDRKFMMIDRVVSMVPNLEASVHVKARVYKMVEKDITRVIKSTKENDDMHVKQKNLRNNDIVIEIHSSDINELGRIKARLEKILRGDTLEYEMRNLDKILYSRQGRDELQKIMRDTNTEIALDNRNMFINIYGQSLNRQTAIRRVCLYLDKIKHSHCKILDLRGLDKPVGYMKAVIVKYGADLESLKTEFELNSVELNHRLHKLTLLGEEDKVQRCAETIKAMEVELMASLGQQAIGPECGICFCEIDSNELYRLESCGHPYCEDCVKGQVESLVSSRDFPLKCAVENCENLWAWQDVMSMVKKGFISKDAVVSSSVSSFVGANKESYRFCLTPDCPVVYKVSKDGKIFRCPDCDLRICTSCHVESHTGLSCAMYKASNGNDEDGVFRWMMQDPSNRKLCPCCSQCIEKNQGCQHMECSICHTHICWICMATFKTSGECYGHLHKSHGTFM
ncbi:hypothetical protein FSP39_025514 [Pinctada imbricata]|uniref:Uncharacterized protein n=1 Tax=Pinctada imbricata TaxID=66713 RepID=A0AA88XH19_PINIB|nr:hypothetical protein FSP39_025514 [Pinctada imbricata]